MSNKIIYQQNIIINDRDADTLLLLCGDVNYSLQSFASVVTWCPIRHHVLKKNGVYNYLFSDFYPGEEKGKALDCILHQRLEECLQKEADTNQQMKWVPLAIQQIQWPLSRYCWLKECARKMFQTFQLKHCVISSGEDDDIVCAVKAVAEEYNVQIEVRAGAFDGTSSTLCCEAPYGLPRRLDPLWFFKLHWYFIKIRKREIAAFIESYPNLKHSPMLISFHLFNMERAFAMLGMMWRKVLCLLRISNRRAVAIIDPILRNQKTVISRALVWGAFSKDEQDIINGAITRFFSHYSHAFLKKFSRRIAYIFSTFKLDRFVLAVDWLDSDMMLTYIAKQYGMCVDYLPHGLVYEDYTGLYRKSFFYPDRVLAWNDNSRNEFRRLNWNAVTIQHPVNQRTIIDLKKLPDNCQAWKVLVMVPEWVAMTQGGREDCAINDLIKVYSGLTKIGVLGLRIHVKYHGTSGFKEVEQAKMIHLKRLQRLLDMRFQILDSSLRVSDVMTQYDLIVICPTTGIFEAVLRGVPLVLFGDGFDRIGALKDYLLPRAKSEDELKKILEIYDHDVLSKIYKDLAHSLQSGELIIKLNI